MNKVVFGLFAHPDDAEFMCAGTLALLAQRGWQIHIATMTAGDCGSKELNSKQISDIRKAEAAESAKILGGSYHCLECEDIFVMYDKPTLLKAIKLMRQIQPAVVFTASPVDYMVDHTTASKIAMTACFSSGIPNIETKGAESFEPVPFLYYVDAVRGRDIFGNEIKPQMIVDISGVIQTKEKMLKCHESQRTWLLKHHGVDEYVEFMKRFSRLRGEAISSSFGEGFRQHLGEAYPEENILKAELGELVHII
ncbi:MAG: PIG-L family deacetylase [Sedimentisphaerales bacterium]|nr:PIG-L family deacetylase [Sedimentisphaerales bacterium]